MLRYAAAAFALFPAASVGQDLGMSAVAVGMAGQVASVVADKVEDKLENSHDPTPCVGDMCCKQSSCLNIPGLRCGSDRGPTKCIGSATFPPKKGMCACVVGSCSAAGTCGSTGNPNFQGNGAAASPAPAATQSSSQPQALQPLSGDSSNKQQWFGQKSAPAAPPTKPDEFSTWHTPQGARLYESRGAPAGAVPPEDHTFVLAAYGMVALSMLVGAGVFSVRLVRKLQDRSPQQALLVPSHEEELTDLDA